MGIQGIGNYKLERLKEYVGWEPRLWQEAALINTCTKRVVRAQRGEGKTELLVMDMLADIFTYGHSNQCFIGPNQGAVKLAYKRFMVCYSKANYVLSKHGMPIEYQTSNNLHQLMSERAKISFHTIDEINGSLRGTHFDRYLIDEGGAFRPGMWPALRHKINEAKEYILTYT